jgi:gas vesicle protein
MSNSDRIFNGEQNNFTDSTENYTTDRVEPETTTTNNGMGRLLFGVLIGATLGGIASVLTNKSTVERINKNVKDLGNAVKKAATNINDTIKDVDDAVNSVATGINDTYKDVEHTVIVNAVDAGQTVRSTVNTVKKPIANNIQSNDKVSDRINQNGTLYKLVPIDQD